MKTQTKWEKQVEDLTNEAKSLDLKSDYEVFKMMKRKNLIDLNTEHMIKDIMAGLK